ncbi:MAG TPA: hypothetical protein VFZ34_29250, partial [Blastocatellia bacterium]|nr:hypothetical protein [Blastocatellia bacterium]
MKIYQEYGWLLHWLYYTALPLTILLIAFRNPQFGRRWFCGVEQRLNKIARRPVLAAGFVGIGSLLISICISLFLRWPLPAITDEFAYLLAADTFAHGRLSTPTHPMWVHFESVQIFHQPTYGSKYHVGQSLALAVGILISGHPIVGVWLSTALACTAVYWMLRAWVTARWALRGGLLAVVYPLTLQWSQNFWGGAVAMLGGAMVLGALGRMMWQPSPRAAWIMGLGLAVLANSRPFEGVVLSLFLSGALLKWMLSPVGPTLRVTAKNIVLPVSIVLLLTAGAMGFYNKKVTGSVFRLPYMVHEETYAMAPFFLWQNSRTGLTYNHEILRQFQLEFWLKPHAEQRESFAGFAKGVGEKIQILANTYFQLWMLAIPLLVFPWVHKTDPWLRFAVLTCGGFVLALLMGTFIQPHYAAPAISMLFVLIVRSMRYLSIWKWRGQATGRFLARGIFIWCAASLVISGLSFTYRTLAFDLWREFPRERARILTELNQ